jgi:hypothetical protein
VSYITVRYETDYDRLTATKEIQETRTPDERIIILKILNGEFGIIAVKSVISLKSTKI